MGEHNVNNYKSENYLEKIIKEVFKQDLKQEEGEEFYDKWASTYERDMTSNNYEGPKLLAEEIVAIYDDVRDIKILDGASGTGMMGKAMYGHGFQFLDALDCSRGMLDKAKDTRVYQKYFQEFLGPNKLPIPDGNYDLIVLCAAFGPGHCEEDSFEELIRITKKGGHLVTLVSGRHFKEDPEGSGFGKGFEDRMMKLQEEGLWTKLEKKTLDNYYKDFQAVFFNLKKC